MLTQAIESPQVSAPSPQFAPYNRLKECRRGVMLYNFNDQYVGGSLDAYAEFSEGEVEMFLQILRPGDLVMDIGANLGGHTVTFAQAVGPTGTVIAMEPQRLVYQTLRNVALNSLTNVHCIQAAVGETAGVVTVPTLDPHRPNNFGGLSLMGNPAGESVTLIRLDSLGVSKCRLIKVDVEGMERQALIGAEGLIRKFRPLLYVENDRPSERDALIRHIDSIGYRMFWHVPMLFNPQNFAGNKTNVFGNIASFNMLCVPKETSMQINGLKAVEVPA